jgi:hypothetical protein
VTQRVRRPPDKGGARQGLERCSTGAPCPVVSRGQKQDLSGFLVTPPYLCPAQRPRLNRHSWPSRLSRCCPSRLQAKATKILHSNNAQEILQAFSTLEAHRAEFATRWLWELIQNARDFPDDSRPMTIRITVSTKQITFAHNGRDFTEEKILSLIYHGSTKQSNPEQLGKFGTGFLSTHLLVSFENNSFAPPVLLWMP